MPKFVYVFHKDDRDELLASGYELLKQDEERNIFIFANQEIQKFGELKMPFVTTDIFTF